MIDEIPLHIPFDNIRGLLQDFTLQLDQRLTQFRKTTRYADVRQSDIRIFISASRAPKSIADLAREHHVTRQAAQASVQRLVAMDVVELVHKPNNHRDKIVAVTVRGREAKQVALQFIAQIETEMASILGAKGLQQFRTLLSALVLGLKARSATDAVELQATGK